MSSRPPGKLLPGNVFLSICGAVCLGSSCVGRWAIHGDSTWSFESFVEGYDGFVAKDRQEFEARLPVVLGLVPEPVTMRPCDIQPAPCQTWNIHSLSQHESIAAVRHKWHRLSADCTSPFGFLERIDQ